jgi:5-methylcytosine-specific restriction protein A
LALKPCLACGALTTNGTYCPRHQPRKARGGSTRQWRNLREQILARDRYACQRCGAAATHVDHIVPVARGGADDPRNLQALCAACDLAKGGD